MDLHAQGIYPEDITYTKKNDILQMIFSYQASRYVIHNMERYGFEIDPSNYVYGPINNNEYESIYATSVLVGTFTLNYESTVGIINSPVYFVVGEGFYTGTLYQYCTEIVNYFKQEINQTESIENEKLQTKENRHEKK